MSVGGWLGDCENVCVLGSEMMGVCVWIWGWGRLAWCLPVNLFDGCYKFCDYSFVFLKHMDVLGRGCLPWVVKKGGRACTSLVVALCSVGAKRRDPRMSSRYAAILRVL